MPEDSYLFSLHSYEVKLNINGVTTRLCIHYPNGPEGMDEADYEGLANEARELMIDAVRQSELKGIRYTGLHTVNIDLEE
jgi:hypothetical protein